MTTVRLPLARDDERRPKGWVHFCEVSLSMSAIMLLAEQDRMLAV
jgi:hypothetical protein